MRDVTFVGLNATGLMGYEDILNGYQFVTDNAARALHITDRYGIELDKPANFVVLDAENSFDAISFNSCVLASYRNGKLIAETKPAETTLHI